MNSARPLHFLRLLMIGSVLLVSQTYSEPANSAPAKADRHSDQSLKKAVATYYDKAVYLDLEELAEFGFADAYDRVKPLLQRYMPDPAPVQEFFDDDYTTYGRAPSDGSSSYFLPMVRWMEKRAG